MYKISKSLGLTPFIIQGTTECVNSIGSCPFDKILDPKLNTYKYFFLNPLIFEAIQIPEVFTGYMDSSPVDFNFSHAYTWDFCKLKRDEGKDTLTSNDIDNITSKLGILDIQPKKL
jgi:hypothetical protein